MTIIRVGQPYLVPGERPNAAKPWAVSVVRETADADRVIERLRFTNEESASEIADALRKEVTHVV